MRVCGACDAGRRERMGRVRSVCALQLFYSLAGERFSGVRRACAGHNIWGGLFDWGRGGPQGSWKARGGVLELTLGCGGRAQRQRAGGNRGKRKSRRLGEQAPRRSIGKRARVQALSRQDFRCEDFRRRRKTVWPSSFAVCRLASHTMFEIGSDSCSYKKIRAFR